MPDIKSEPIFFPSPAEFRKWLKRNHASVRELWVGFHKRATGRPSMTWPQSVDEALCFGWIDGIRKSLDAERYVIRFTPRKPSSIWSAVNTRRANELVKEGRMQPAGAKAFKARDPKRSGVYSFEQREAAKLSPAAEAQFKRVPKAWAFFHSLPPGYRKVATFWVVSAKREETRASRLERLIEDSAAGRRIAVLQPSSKKRKDAGG